MDPKELSQQLSRPTGKTGLEIAIQLNESNKKLYELAFQTMNLTNAQHLLEIGFGNGAHFPQYFASQNELKVTGVDISPDMCREAKQRNRDLIENGLLEIYCADTSAMPFGRDAFDTVVTLNVIYFWNPPEPALSYIHSVLKPGGKLIMGYRPRHVVEHFEFTQHNFILYEPDELNALLERCGFNVLKNFTNSYDKQAMDGSELTVTDCCILAEKT